MLEPHTIALLIVVAFAAGWVDAVTGGGGMLQLPALLIALPQQVTALGTNKVSSIFGTTAAATTYLRKVSLDLKTAVPMALAAFGGAAAGALTATSLPVAAFRPIIVALLIIVWFWTLLTPSLGQSERLRFAGRRRHYGIAVVAGLVIGFYDGILGPGTGSFLLIVLVAGLGYSFLQASATAKIVNIGTNAAALIVFGITGSVLWLLGLAMAVANVGGAVIGARTAVRRGSGFVRAVFLVVVGLLILRLGFDLVAGESPG